MALMVLREAGERLHDLNGCVPDVSAEAAGHSKETRARYYNKVSYEGRTPNKHEISLPPPKQKFYLLFQKFKARIVICAIFQQQCQLAATASPCFVCLPDVIILV